MTKQSPTAIVGSPIHFPFSGLTAPNRTLKSAMTERLCTYDETNLEARGHVTPEYINLYKTWGEGKIGVIVLGNLPIQREALEAKKNMIIDKDNKWDAAEELKPVIQACKAHGSLVIGQLTHGGRQVSEEIVKTPRSSSDIQAPPMGGMTFGKPTPLTEEEVDDIIDRFAYGAEVLYKAGADGVQLHGAHGYLLSQFLSSRVNKRTDQWGGDLEHKSRIVFRIIEEIKKRVPAAATPGGGFLLSMKLNSADFAEGGFTEDESKRVCEMLQDSSLDLVETSGGTYESMAFEHKRESTKKREAYFLEFADQIRPSLTESVLCVTGGFRSIGGMAEAIDGGSCSMVGLARPLCAEPHFVADLLCGKTTAAKPNLVPSALSVPAAYMQLGAIGAGKTPLDLSIQEQADEAVKIITGGKQEQDKKPVKDQDISSYEKGGQGKETEA